MPPCATEQKLAEAAPIYNLILPVPDTDFRDYLDEVDELSRFTPKIIEEIEKDLDDFLKLTIDSTSVKANSSWPTDAKILTGLLMRANRLGQKLNVFGFENFRQGWVPRWLEEMGKLVFQICLVAGKVNSKGKLKKRYRGLLRLGRKAVNVLTTELNRLEQGLMIETLPPSRRVLLQRVLDQIETDLADANRVIDYANDRVFHDKKLPSTEKVLSLSDGSAAYIKKGSRLEEAATGGFG